MAGLVSPREREATRIAQQYMGLNSETRLVPDGWWGSYTQKVYEAQKAADKAVVDALLSAQGTSAIKLRQAFVAEKATNPSSKAESREERQRNLSLVGDMVEMVRRTAVRENVDVTTALKICWLESKFLPNAVSWTGAKGLFQFTTIAERDVYERAGFNLMGREFDPESNATSGMKYIKLVARDLKVPTSDTAAVYMGFNIGPTAARLYKAGILNDTVKLAISRQAYGDPSVYGKRLAAAVASAQVA